MARISKKRSGNIITCRNNVQGTLDFYLITGTETCYLFRTRYSKLFFHEYENGKAVEEILIETPAFKHRKSVHRKRSDDLAAKRLEYIKQKLRERIIRTVKYIEREYILSALEDASDCDAA